MSALKPPRSASPRRLRNALVPIAIGCSVAFLTAVALTLLAYTLIGLGANPESIDTGDLLAPLLGVFAGSAEAARRRRTHPWLAGLTVGGFAVALWLTMWCFLVGRLSPWLWWWQGVGGLAWHHLLPWACALVVSGAGVAGGRVLLAKAPRLWGSLYMVCALVLATAMLWQSVSTRFGRSELARGITLWSAPPTADGTTVRLLRFDFGLNPNLRLRLYDADSDDATPYDNHNTTWLGQGLDLVLDKVRARDAANHRELFCLFNAVFFGGEPGLIARHDAPIVADGQALYNVNSMQREWPEQAWVFGERIANARPLFVLRHQVAWPALRQFQTALVGVRPLRVAGRSVPLKPGMGNTTLRCSRTSLGWSADSRFLYLLIVRDPDGEGASNRQKHNGGPQTGGWDVHEVQEYWARRGLPLAVLLDGGESTQLAYLTSHGRYVSMTSAYHLSYTLAYWRSRPLRICLPMLPVAQNRGGVLNYLYVDGPQVAEESR